jgi:hypothetical protein
VRWLAPNLTNIYTYNFICRPCYQANFNPLAGCLPTFATLPVFIGLYRALSNAATEAGPAIRRQTELFDTHGTIFGIKLTMLWYRSNYALRSIATTEGMPVLNGKWSSLMIQTGTVFDADVNCL